MNATKRSRGWYRATTAAVEAATAQLRAENLALRAQLDTPREPRTSLVQPRLRDTKP